MNLLNDLTKFFSTSRTATDRPSPARRQHRPDRVYPLIIALLFSALLFPTASTLANTSQTQSDEWQTGASETIRKQEAKFKTITPGKISIDVLASDLKDINQIKNNAHECIASTESELQKITEDLATLGEPADKENPDVVKKRQSLTTQQKELDKQLSSCKLLLLQSQDLIETINQLQHGVLAEQLSAQTPHIFSVIIKYLEAPVAGLEGSLKFLSAQYSPSLFSTGQLVLLAMLIFAAAAAGIFLRRSAAAEMTSIKPPSDSVSAFALAARFSLMQALPVLLPVTVAAIFLSLALPLSPLPFITKTSYLLGIYLGLITTINILLDPAPPAPIYLTQPAEASRRFARQLKILATLIILGFFLFTGDFKTSLNAPVYYLSRGIYATLLIINLISILWLVRLFSWAMLSRESRLFLSLVLIISLLAELAGYRNLSSFVIGGLLATSVSLVLTMLLYKLIKDLFDGLDEGRLDWEKALRKQAEVKAGALFPGLIWLRLIIFVSLWAGFALLALKIWKLDDPWLEIITSYITEGFHIGSLNVTPTLLAGGILAFAVTLNLTRYIKTHLLPYGLKYTSLDRGAREAIISLAGYAGVTVAVLIALSITGVEMQNIAIIAGALSVGIGFGLQNIVNNFISGLILLFERPVRRGDWIITGDTEGYVKSINIRSTQIQTFDRADVIVPNSELITAKVTNWMLLDPYGRVTLPVGVSYDSDVEKVKQILLDIADSHPLVMKEHPQLSAPKVLFRRFGDSSLDFELRCFISDIDQRLDVVSALNFAIIAAFRREGIEIPFPQRVVTMANLKTPEPADEQKKPPAATAGKKKKKEKEKEKEKENLQNHEDGDGE